MKQREIKFRCWDKENNCMYEWDVLSKRNNFIEALEMNKENLWELMQFTGLLDKNGKEIWEGDLISYDEKSHPSMVRWNDKTGGFSCWVEKRKLWNGKIEKPHWNHRDWVNASSNRIVVGNAYSNPELLNQK